MLLNNDIKLSFNDVLIVPKRSRLASRKAVNLERNFFIRGDSYNSFSCVPIIASNMATGTFEMMKSLSKFKMMTCISKHHDWVKQFYDIDDKDERIAALEHAINWGFYTIGKCKADIDELYDFTLSLAAEFRDEENGAPKIKICVDIANGYSQDFADFVHSVREKFPRNLIMAGNVCTPEMTQELIISGADIVKIGIGPGSMCTTRQQTGVGYPQISAAIESADVAHGLGSYICLDGGMTCSGDIAKAFCANADFVMLGGMLAGTDECEGEIKSKFIHDGTYKLKDYRQENYTDEKTIAAKCNAIIHIPEYEPNIVEKKFKEFYGMSSSYAQQKNGKKVPDYATSEGGSDLVEYKGLVESVVNNILGGLRSCGTYIGATEIKHFGKCGTLIRVNSQKQTPFVNDQLKFQC